MSTELLPCLHCGAEPKETTFESWKYYCPTKHCPLYRIAMNEAAWNRRFVCLDKNGDKVLAGDVIRYTPRGQAGKKHRWCKCEIMELRPPRYGYGLVGDNDFETRMFYREEIELIKEKK